VRSSPPLVYSPVEKGDEKNKKGGRKKGRLGGERKRKREEKIKRGSLCKSRPGKRGLGSLKGGERRPPKRMTA